MDIKKESWVR